MTTRAENCHSSLAYHVKVGTIKSYCGPVGARSKWRINFNDHSGPHYFTLAQVYAICITLESLHGGPLV